MLIASVSFAQIKKVIIKTNSVQYGTQTNYKGLDFWKMDGDAVPSGYYSLKTKNLAILSIRQSLHVVLYSRSNQCTDFPLLFFHPSI